MEIILRFLLSVLIITGLIYILPGIKVTRFYCAIVAAIPISIINMLITPLFEHYNVPLTMLGLAGIIVVLDALLLWFFGLILKRLKVDGFGWAFVFAVVLSLIIYLIELIFAPGYLRVLS